MNIAVGAFLITLLFIPAISFRLALNNHRQLKELLGALTITDTIWLFILVPICTHLVLLPILFLCGVTVKFDLILNIIYSNRDFHIDNHTMGWDIIYFLAYVLVAFAVAFVISNLIVTNKRMNYKIVKLLGAANEWYELFDGRYSEAGFELILLDVVVNSRESTLIYQGYLYDYYFQTRSTELDYIVLRQVSRQDLRSYSVTEHVSGETGKMNYFSNERGEKIPLAGDLVVIPAKEILNMNVTYLRMTEEEDGEEEDIESTEE